MAVKAELQLRGFVQCSRCAGELTGSGSHGNGGRYFYYHCRNGCPERFRADAAHQQFSELLDTISGNKKMLATFELMVGSASNKDSTTRKAEAVQVQKDIELHQTRLTKAQTKFVDDELTREEFNAIKARIEPELSRLVARQRDLQVPDRNEDELINFGFHYLRNLPKLFADAGLEQKRRLLGSTFPADIKFSEGKCRTTDSDNILALIAAPGAGFSKKRNGTGVQFPVPSCSVDNARQLSNFFAADLQSIIDY